MLERSFESASGCSTIAICHGIIDGLADNIPVGVARRCRADGLVEARRCGGAKIPCPERQWFTWVAADVDATLALNGEHHRVWVFLIERPGRMLTAERAWKRLQLRALGRHGAEYTGKLRTIGSGT